MFKFDNVIEMITRQIFKKNLFILLARQDVSQLWPLFCIWIAKQQL